jgi:archaemetzincin
MPGKSLQLVALGNVQHVFLKEMAESVRAQLGIDAAASTQAYTTPAYAFNKDRNQYHSSAILRRLTQAVPKDKLMLAFTDVDVFMPDTPFVFGEADRDLRVAVASVFRLKEGGTGALGRRAQSEAIHQAGHLLGLSFCEDARCVMFSPTQPSELERRGLSPCSLCRQELAKIQRLW